MTCLRLRLSFLLASALVWAPVFPLRAGSSSTKALGAIANSRAATARGTNAVPGSSIFNGDTVAVGPGGAAWLLLVGGGQAHLGQNSRVRLTQAGNAIQIEVLTGELTIHSTPNGPLVGRVASGTLQPEGGGPGVGEIIFVQGDPRARFGSEQGVWTVTTPSESVTLEPGEMVEAQVGPTKGQTEPSAGEVAVVIPAVNLQRGAQQLAATPHAPVFWGDVAQTARLGRVRVALNDGSLLNVGSASSLQIVKHDAAVQQTQIELLHGRVRASAVHLTHPGGGYQVHTRLGTAGVVGTDFFLALEGDTLRLIVFEGIVRFCNLAGVCVDVSAGQRSRIHGTMGPLPPSAAPKALVAEAVNSTEVVPPGAARKQQTGIGTTKLILIGGGVAGAGTGIGLALGSSEGPVTQKPNAVSPVVP
jgi:hypothetical protein